MGQKCARCGKAATMNIQKLWMKWKYDAEEDEYSSQPELLGIEPSECDNSHFCDECAKLWGEGEI